MLDTIDDLIQPDSKTETPEPLNLLRLMKVEKRGEAAAPAAIGKDLEDLFNKQAVSITGRYGNDITRLQLESAPANQLSTFLKKNFDDLDHLTMPRPTYSMLNIFNKPPLNVEERRGVIGIGDVELFSRLADQSKRADYVRGEFASFKSQHEINRGAEGYLSAIPKGAVIGGLICAIALRRPAGLLRSIGIGGGITASLAIPFFDGLDGMARGRREADLLYQNRLDRVNRILERVREK